MSFTSDLGAASALWEGFGTPAVHGRDYDVEIDVGVPLRVGDNVHVGINAKPPIRMNGSLVELTGTVDAVEPDGVICVRLSPGCIFMADMLNAELRASDRIQLVLEPSSLVLTPVGV